MRLLDLSKVFKYLSSPPCNEENGCVSQQEYTPNVLAQTEAVELFEQGTEVRAEGLSQTLTRYENTRYLIV